MHLLQLLSKRYGIIILIQTPCSCFRKAKFSAFTCLCLWLFSFSSNIISNMVLAIFTNLITHTGETMRNITATTISSRTYKYFNKYYLINSVIEKICKVAIFFLIKFHLDRISHRKDMSDIRVYFLRCFFKLKHI